MLFSIILPADVYDGNTIRANHQKFPFKYKNLRNSKQGDDLLQKRIAEGERVKPEQTLFWVLGKLTIILLARRCGGFSSFP
jgi:hypothetical protein